MTLDWVFRKCTGQSTEYWAERGDLDWYSLYADGRDAGKGILTADWNHFPRMAAEDSHRTDEGRTAQEFNWNRGRKFQDILERMGYRLEWSDQIQRCDHCGGCIDTEPGYYGDTAHYALLRDSDVLCEHCVRNDFAEEYLESLEVTRNHRIGAVHIAGVNPADFGYALIEDGFENGWYPGQNDDPSAIAERLRERGYDRLLFEITDQGQFDTRFRVWRKVESESESD